MASDDAGRAKAMAAVKAMFDRYKLLAAQRPADHIDFDRQVMEDLKLVDAGLDGSVVYEFYMSKNYSNLNNVMHGGAAGPIMDMSTTTAICPLSKPGFWEFMGGVTRSLNINYLKPVPLEQKVRLNSKVISIGKQLALIRGEMTSLDGKITYLIAEHHKVNTPVLPHLRKVRIPWDDEFESEHEINQQDKGLSSKI